MIRIIAGLAIVAALITTMGVAKADGPVSVTAALLSFATIFTLIGLIVLAGWLISSGLDKMAER